MTAPDPHATPSSRDELLADAVRVLTQAARLTRPVLTRDETASESAGPPVWVDSGRREPDDFAEFVTQAVAGAAANIGSIEAVLAGRPGSWEADYVRNMLTSTVGHDEAYLLEHRTEPLTVQVFVDEILVDLDAGQDRAGLVQAYEAAQREIARRYDELGIPSPFLADGSATDRTEEQERQAAEYDALEERLEEQRERDWAAYGEALKANVEAAAARLEGLRMPVVVTVNLETFRGTEDRRGDSWGLADRLLNEAVQTTPLPGDGRPPLERLT